MNPYTSTYFTVPCGHNSVGLTGYVSTQYPINPMNTAQNTPFVGSPISLPHVVPKLQWIGRRNEATNSSLSNYIKENTNSSMVDSSSTQQGTRTQPAG